MVLGVSMIAYGACDDDLLLRLLLVLRGVSLSTSLLERGTHSFVVGVYPFTDLPYLIRECYLCFRGRFQL